jgi:hypothetical protein|uniref:Uncharacterized protein n=1 Tax=viral metagenome TaxID=1070528 RepID=A0A6C0IUQ2_9ZZZZ
MSGTVIDVGSLGKEYTDEDITRLLKGIESGDIGEDDPPSEDEDEDEDDINVDQFSTRIDQLKKELGLGDIDDDESGDEKEDTKKDESETDDDATSDEEDILDDDGEASEDLAIKPREKTKQSWREFDIKEQPSEDRLLTDRLSRVLAGDKLKGPETGLFAMEEARRKEWRLHRLDDISELIDILEMDGEDLSHLKPKPGMSDEMIADVLQLLRKKNETSIDVGLFTKGVIFLTKVASGFCDGTHGSFGFYPNLVGLEKDVGRVIRRNSFNIGQITTGLRESYGIGGGGQIGLQILMEMVGRHAKNTSAESTSKKASSEITGKDR